MTNTRKGRRRPRGQYIKGNVDEVLALGALDTVVLIKSDFDETVNEKTLISSLVAAYTLDQNTAPEGPILFGIAHSDYSASEIEAYIESTTSWNTGDKVAQEVGKRLIRVLGQFAADSLAGLTDVRFNGGVPVKTKLNWMLDTGATITLWGYNKSSVQLTTGSSIQASGHANLWQV